MSHDFFYYVFVVVVTESTTKLVIVHVELVFAESPESGDLLGVKEFELPVVVRPSYDMVVLVTDQ